MLKAEPNTRLTAAQALSHPWIVSLSVPPLIPVLEIVEKIKKYQTVNKVKRIAMRKLAHSVHIPAYNQLAEVFLYMDPLHCGAITVDDLKRVTNGAIVESELQELVNKFDYPIRPEFPTPCQVSFSDFVAIMVGSDLYRNMGYIQYTFNLIDVNHTGFIKSGNLFFLSTLMGLSLKQNQVSDSLHEYGDKLDFDGFVKLFKESILFFWPPKNRREWRS